VPGRTAGRAPTYGRASGARVDVRPGTAARAGYPEFGWFCLGCMAVHRYRTPVCGPVFLYSVVLDARGFIEPLIFLEIAREVFFSIKT